MTKPKRIRRGHASFYDWSDKQQKEAGIVESFLDPTNHLNLHSYTSFEVPDKDPPDAILYTNLGNRCLVELTELVNENAVSAELKLQRTRKYDDASNYACESEKWADSDYFWTSLNSRVLEKDGKCRELFVGNSYVGLLLHTDEGFLEAFIHEHLAKTNHLVRSQFSEIWLLLSYQPGTQSRPVIKLK